MSREYSQSCSLACALDRVGERWSLLIVRELLLGPLRFSDLARSVGGAPTDVLTKRLREMEKHGIVCRRELAPPASAVAYELTEIGRGLEKPMLELGRWGLNFDEAGNAADVTPASLATVVRLILQPPSGTELTLGLRSGDLSYRLRIEDGWIEASRGEATDADLTLAGDPTDVLAAIVSGGPAESGIEIQGEQGLLEDLRAMVVLPERFREAAPLVSG